MTTQHYRDPSGRLESHGLRLLSIKAVGSNTCAILMALALGALIPHLAFQSNGVPGYPYSSGYVSTAACVLAILWGHVVMARLSHLALVEGQAFILIPCYVAAYAFFAISNPNMDGIGDAQTALSAVLSITWYVTLELWRRRRSARKIGVIGPGRFRSLLDKQNWVPIERENIPKDVSMVVYDANSDLSLHGTLLERVALRQIPLVDSAALQEMTLGRVSFHVNPTHVLGPLRRRRLYRGVKLYLDLLFAAVAMVLLTPLFLLLILVIRLDSPGPAFFKQRRIGYRGVPFTCYKFRTMSVDNVGPLYTEQNDGRITRIGGLLRMTRLDELPQIVNILLGQMSWIGPRPEAVALARLYRKNIPSYSYRHVVRPGITGWAAVHQGNVGLVEAAGIKLEYDLYYIRNLSFWLDGVILVKTIKTLITGFGAR